RAHTLRKLSPYSPAARAALVREDWDAIKEHALEWEKESQRPDVLLALGQRYVKLHQSDDAERCFKRSLALSPDLPTYRLLAGVYQERGNTEQWLSTLQEVLKQPDTGLNHAQVQVQIARHFMSKKEFKKAQPYADAAVDALQPVIQEGKTPMAEILAALLLDEAGDSNGRDRVLSQIGSKNRFRPLVDFFVAALARGEKAEVDVAAADKVIKSLSAEDQ